MILDHALRFRPERGWQKEIVRWDGEYYKLSEHARIGRGEIQEESLRLVEYLVETHKRCAPWTDLILCGTGDSLCRSDEHNYGYKAGEWARFGGLYDHPTKTIIVTLRNSVYVAQTLHHEIFHAVDYDTNFFFQPQGVYITIPYPIGYGRYREEVLARQYQHYASYLDEGGVLDLNDDKMLKIFDEIHQGEYARARRQRLLEIAQAQAEAEAERLRLARKAARRLVIWKLLGFGDLHEYLVQRRRAN